MPALRVCVDCQIYSKIRCQSLACANAARTRSCLCSLSSSLSQLSPSRPFPPLPSTLLCMPQVGRAASPPTSKLLTPPPLRQVLSHVSGPAIFTCCLVLVLGAGEVYSPWRVLAALVTLVPVPSKEAGVAAVARGDPRLVENLLIAMQLGTGTWSGQSGLGRHTGRPRR